MADIFKTCTSCANHWQEMSDLIRDEDVVIIGYQASFNNSDEGLFLFTHNVDGCGTTFAVPAESLKVLYQGPKHTIHMDHTPCCDGYCLHEDDISSPCLKECDRRWARDILQILRNHGPEELLSKLETSSNTEAA